MGLHSAYFQVPQSIDLVTGSNSRRSGCASLFAACAAKPLQQRLVEFVWSWPGLAVASSASRPAKRRGLACAGLAACALCCSVTVCSFPGSTAAAPPRGLVFSRSFMFPRPCWVSILPPCPPPCRVQKALLFSFQNKPGVHRHWPLALHPSQACPLNPHGAGRPKGQQIASHRAPGPSLARKRTENNHCLFVSLLLDSRCFWSRCLWRLFAPQNTRCFFFFLFFFLVLPNSILRVSSCCLESDRTI
ncbi:hypothetical protein BDY21DRAFT_39030 [Lineolata rhizophorae]|uniref:Transmembrane protein n=1 Tax=Lineolata rhizophorae TaxID=578093 RepID=A0A6A6P0R9_9PEZI|nr:hypothetical protein BDY21DRAFT_39030 [Lineolata rhizophorae]